MYFLKAVIISDSEGNRLRPITCNLPKSMIPIMNRPLIEHTVRLLKRHGIKNITIAADYLREEIKKHFSSFDKEEKIEIVPLRNLETFFENDDVLFINGSVLTDIDIERLIDTHKKSGATATLVCRKDEKAYEYGGINHDGNMKVVSYSRFPDFLHPMQLSFSGISIVSANSFVSDCVNICDVAKNLVLKKASVFYCDMDCYIKDISDFESYNKAIRDFFDKKINLKFPCEEKAPGVWIDEKATVMQGAVIVPPVFIGEGSLINRGARIESYSQIGNRVTVDCFASIKRSVVMDDSYICEGASLSGVTLGRKCEIGAESAAYEGSVIGERTKIGKHCTVRTMVHIWPDKYIEDESSVSENIIWEKNSMRSLFSDGNVFGVVNKELTVEFACSLARACAEVLGEKIAVSCDQSKAGSMIKNALIAGVCSAGATPYDFGEQPLPITRSGIRFYNLCGGIALSTFVRSGIMYGAIDIINSQGADVEKEDTEKIEKLATGNLSKRVSATKITEPEFMFEYKLYYLKQLVNSTTKKPLGANVIIHCPSSWAKELLKSAAEDLQCNFTFTLISDKEAFSQEVTSGGYDMGVICDYKCETLSLVSQSGRVLSEYDYSALCALITMKSFDNARIYVPLSSPESIEILAERYNAKVKRSKISPPSLMNELSKNDQKSFVTQFIYRFDAVGAIILLLDFLYTSGETLDSLMREIPPSHIVNTSVSCSVQKQDEIIKNFFKKHKTQNEEDADALKISFDDGWVLIVPKKNESAIDVIGYGSSYEYAKEIADICTDEIVTGASKTE